MRQGSTPADDCIKVTLNVTPNPGLSISVEVPFALLAEYSRMTPKERAGLQRKLNEVQKHSVPK
jgi:hypothetical protein